MTLDKFEHVSPNLVFMIEPAEWRAFPIDKSPLPAEPVEPAEVTPPSHADDDPLVPTAIVPADDSLPAGLPVTNPIPTPPSLFDNESSPFASSGEGPQASIWDSLDDKEDDDDRLVMFEERSGHD
jgi:hypothetical protein